MSLLLCKIDNKSMTDNFTLSDLKRALLHTKGVFEHVCQGKVDEECLVRACVASPVHNVLRIDYTQDQIEIDHDLHEGYYLFYFEGLVFDSPVKDVEWYERLSSTPIKVAWQEKFK